MNVIQRCNSKVQFSLDSTEEEEKKIIYENVIKMNF